MVHSKNDHSNGTASFYEYDQEGRITQVRIEDGGDTIDKFRYEFTATGNISKIWSDMDGSWIEYTYDSTREIFGYDNDSVSV